MAALSIPAGLVALVAWHWPEREAVRGLSAGKEDRTRPLPVDVSDSRATGWWSMVLIMLSLAVIFGSFVAAYYYLAGNSVAWPPPGIDKPEIGIPIIATALGIVAASAMYVGVGGVQRGNQGRLLIGITLGLVLGVASTAVAVYEWGRQDFDLDTHAYSSSFLVILGVQILQMAAAAVFTLIVLVWAWMGYYNERRHLAVRNAALCWYYVGVVWIVVLAVLYVSPHVLDIS